MSLARAIALLGAERAASPAGAVHLAIGAIPRDFVARLKTELGLDCIICDDDSAALERLAAAGFQTKKIDFDARDGGAEALATATGGQALHSISCLDKLLRPGPAGATAAAIGALARAHGAPCLLALSDFRAGRRAAELVFGFQPEMSIDDDDGEDLLRAAGLRRIAGDDILVPPDALNLPQDHPSRARGTALHALLLSLARQAGDEPSIVLCTAATPAAPENPPPLISALIRTQGRRSHTLVDLLTALAAQTDTDFEVVLVGHGVAEADRPALDRIIADTPDFLRDRIRLFHIEGGGRARPLNFGFAQARGTYVAIIDDDDIPFAHWVETYRRLHQTAPGRVLRSVTARQDVVSVNISHRRGLRATGTIERLYPAQLTPVDHLVGNFSPTTTLAFPRAAFRDLGLRFDEDLTTTEDWDFLIRVSAVCGLATSPEICGLYRWWQGEDCSQTAHGPEEWRDNYLAILRKQDDLALIADGASLARIREQYKEREALQRARDEAASHIEDVARDLRDAQHRIADVNGTLEQTRNDAERQIAELNGTLEQTRRDAERQIAELNGTLEQTRRDAERQIAELNGTLAQTRNDAERQIAELNAAFLSAKRENQRRVDSLTEALNRAHDAASRRAAEDRDQREAARLSIATLQQATDFGQRLGPLTPPDLARALRKGLQLKIFMLKIRFLLSYPLPKKRRALRERRRLYRQFLRNFISPTAANRSPS